MKIVEGDILEAKEEFILQQCNCKTNYGKGLSAAIFDKYPYANTYKNGYRKPGTIDVMKKEGDKTIININSQDAPGKPTSKEPKELRIFWFKHCLKEVASLKLGPIAVPYKIGCGLAGGNWEDYKTALEESGLDIVIYKL